MSKKRIYEIDGAAFSTLEELYEEVLLPCYASEEEILLARFH